MVSFRALKIHTMIFFGWWFFGVVHCINTSPLIEHEFPMEDTVLPAFNPNLNMVPFFDGINQSSLYQFIDTFSKFHNRHPKSPHGTASSEWLFEKINDVVAHANPFIRVTTTKIRVQNQYHNFTTPTIVARIEPREGSDGELTIISATLDAMIKAFCDTVNSRTPGADHNASGAAAAFHVFEILISSPYFKPKTPIEFQWYGADDWDNTGSSQMAASRRRVAQKIHGVLHLDLIGFDNGKKQVGIVSNQTDFQLSTFIHNLFKHYSPDLEVVPTECKYSCGSHKSWYSHGYRVARPIESAWNDKNPSEGGERDTIEKLSMPRIAEFVKIAIAYTIQLTMSDSE